MYFVLLPYIAVNLANIVYHLRWRRDEFHASAGRPLLGFVDPPTDATSP